jgi:ABC-2 type transport system ATP-binding protein
VAIIKKGRLLRQGAVSDVTSGAPMAVLKAADMNILEQAVTSYPESHWVKRRDEYVVAELATDDLATLNRYLVEQGIYVSELKLQHRSLEDVFMEVTGGGEHGMGEVA